MDDAVKPDSEGQEEKAPKIKAEDNPWYLLATLGAAFSEGALFLGAAFPRLASFDAAAFFDWASFDGATLSGKAFFDGAPFSGVASFGGAAFGGQHVQNSQRCTALSAGRCEQKGSQAFYFYSKCE